MHQTMCVMMESPVCREVWRVICYEVLHTELRVVEYLETQQCVVEYVGIQHHVIVYVELHYYAAVHAESPAQAARCPALLLQLLPGT